MKNISKTIFAVLVAAAISTTFIQQAQAVPITGGISLAGGYTTDTGDVNTAHAFTSFFDVEVTGGAGTYAGIPNGMSSPPVTMVPFTFNPFVPPVNSLWSLTYLSNTYSFDLLTCIIAQQGGDTLTLHGTGTLHATGFTDTAGAWVFTANELGGTFSFSSSNGVIPDGGTTVALLGIALAGIEGARRMFRARKS
jgi:hypothetical protein